ncbi:hypothetical protein, partial [Paraburkholderia caledonica]|uniref:hypothetical protein n=1 Tax=Paraburkholderia caledonica TaxID=134536 RepID=UPI001C4F5201
DAIVFEQFRHGPLLAADVEAPVSPVERSAAGLLRVGAPAVASAASVPVIPTRALRHECGDGCRPASI